MDIRMHWHPSGDFLCVKVDRLSKNSSSRSRLTSFELFRMRAKAIAVDVVELQEEVPLPSSSAANPAHHTAGYLKP